MDQQCALLDAEYCYKYRWAKVLWNVLKEEAVRKEHGPWLAMFGVQPLWLQFAHRCEPAILNLRRRLARGSGHWALPLAVPGGYLALGTLRLPAYTTSRIEGISTQLACKLVATVTEDHRLSVLSCGFSGRGRSVWTSRDAVRWLCAAVNLRWRRRPQRALAWLSRTATPTQAERPKRDDGIV